MKKSVLINCEKNEVLNFELDNNGCHSRHARHSTTRSLIEKAVVEKPKKTLDTIKNLISKWRNHKISIVFGNLGRQPYLLTYYLDLCFGYLETICISCRWKLNSDYQTEHIPENLDFLFLVEPPFGHSILEMPKIKHLVVLTSHLNLNVPYFNVVYIYLHLSNVKKYLVSDPNIEEGSVFIPPLFHENIPELSEGPIILDVRNSKTANEAYLKLLTGKEIIRKRPFNIWMDKRDHEIIKLSLANTKHILQKHGFDDWNKTFYSI